MNKNHWYDGIFYDKVIAPNQDSAYQIVKSLISDNSSLIDVGCGTGRLAFKLKDKFAEYDGVDLSERNIRRAKSTLSKNPESKIKFHHSDIFYFLKFSGKKYNYAVLSYIIHEINADQREKLLLYIRKSVQNIIVVDYLFPRPTGIWSFLNEVVEFLAGQDHYKNFKSFITKEGIYGLSERSGLKIIKEIKNNPSTTHIAVLQ